MKVVFPNGSVLFVEDEYAEMFSEIVARCRKPYSVMWHLMSLEKISDDELDLSVKDSDWHVAFDSKQDAYAAIARNQEWNNSLTNSPVFHWGNEMEKFLERTKRGKHEPMDEPAIEDHDEKAN